MQALVRVLLRSKRLAEAIPAGDTLAQLAPTSLWGTQWIIFTYAANGDLPGAHAAIKAALARGIAPTKLVVHMAGYLESSWLFEPGEARLLDGLTAKDFEDHRAWWAQSLATAYWDAGNRTTARAYADSALAPSRAAIARDSKIIQNRLLYGLMLAYLGRYDEAIAEGEWALARVQRGRGSDSAYELQTMARIYTIAGQPDKAIAALKELLMLPWHVSAAWLRLDPAYTPLRNLPAFQLLTADLR